MQNFLKYFKTFAYYYEVRFEWTPLNNLFPFRLFKDVMQSTIMPG